MMISDEVLKEFLETTEVFSVGFLQDFKTFMDFLSAKEITLNHAYDCVSQKQTNTAKMIYDNGVAVRRLETRNCPECGGGMRIVMVNHGPAYIVGGDYKTLWYCLDVLECGYEEYSEKSVEEWSLELKAIEDLKVIKGK
jgi:hypothetical protein